MKSLDDLSAPLPVAAPGGRGAGTRPQFPFRIFSASAQYFSPLTRPDSILLAAALKMSAAFRRASSLSPMASWALKASTDIIGGGFFTKVAVNRAGGEGWPVGMDWRIEGTAGLNESVDEGKIASNSPAASDNSP